MIDASTMLGSLMQSYAPIAKFLVALSALLGALFTIMALVKVAHLNKHGGAPGGTGAMSVVMLFFSGVSLWYFSGSVDTLLETMFGAGTAAGSLMSYSGPSSASAQTKQMFQAVIGAFSIIGYVTVMRGWMIARKIGGGQAAPDAAKGAIIRLFAGTAMINIVGFVNVITSTLGFGNLLS